MSILHDSFHFSIKQEVKSSAESEDGRDSKFRESEKQMTKGGGLRGWGRGERRRGLRGTGRQKSRQR